MKRPSTNTSSISTGIEIDELSGDGQTYSTVALEGLVEPNAILENAETRGGIQRCRFDS
jgi:hypothetical protein